mmetsp:Transcript_62287/g.148701  ORF Transcript_62287/g.148701 Transcript_62287/m.148701 type:complete len:255 (-) Transcript_62287:42-806(-)
MARTVCSAASGQSHRRSCGRTRLYRLSRWCTFAVIAIWCCPQRPAAFCGRARLRAFENLGMTDRTTARAEGPSSQASPPSAPDSPAAAEPEETPDNPIEACWKKVKAELGDEMQKARDARLGFFLKDQFVLQKQDQSANEMPLYKRKYQTLGTNLVSQEASAKAFGRVVRKCRESENVKEMIKLVRSREYMDEVDAVQIGDELAGFFFIEVLPEARTNPVLDAVAGTIATFFALGVLLAIVICCLGSTPVELDE